MKTDIETDQYDKKPDTTLPVAMHDYFVIVGHHKKQGGASCV